MFVYICMYIYHRICLDFTALELRPYIPRVEMNRKYPKDQLDHR